MPGREEELWERPVVTGVKNMASRSRRGRRPGSYHRGGRRKIETRRSKLKFHQLSTVDRETSRFFRCCWPVKKPPGNSWPEEELQVMAKGAQGLAKVLGPNLRWQELREQELEAKEVQLLRQYQKQEKEEELAPVMPRPAVQRTYSRKGRGQQVKQSLSRSQTPVAVGASRVEEEGLATLLPPSQASLLGLRGLQLRTQALRNSSEGQSKQDVREQEHKQADDKFVKRFIQMFYWPSKMSAVVPPKQERLFEESEDEDVIDDDEEDVVEEQDSRPPSPLAGPSKSPPPVMGRGLHGVMRPRNTHLEL